MFVSWFKLDTVINCERRRGYFQIMCDILNVAMDGVLKTELMHKANLSYTQLEDYIETLQRLKMLKTSLRGKMKVYITTDKGITFIDKVRRIKEYLKE